MKKYALRTVDENFKTYGSDFIWVKEGLVKRQDVPVKDQDEILYACLNGESEEITHFSGGSNYKANFLLLEIDDCIDLGMGFVKFEQANVIAHSKDVNEIQAKIRDLTGRTDLKQILVTQSTSKSGEVQVAGAGSFQLSGDDSIQTAGSQSTQTAGSYSTQTAGNNSSQTASSYSTQTVGYRSTQIAGVYSNQIAKYSSTQIAGSYSTQTAGFNSTHIIYGDTSYIIKNGKNCTLIQIFDNTSVVLDLDEALKDFNIGGKVKIVRGKVVGKYESI